MSTENVKVKFTPSPTPNGTDQWDFDRTKVRVREPSRIILHRDPANAPWRLKDVKFPNGDGGDFTTTPSPTGQILTIEDAYTQMGEVCYKVIVTDASGVEHESPDPQIVNEPHRMLAPVHALITALVGAVIGAILGALIDANTGPATSRGMLKGLLVGAVLGAALGAILGRMLAATRKG